MSPGAVTELRFENVRDFDPAQTFECGQCFRFTREKNGSYTGVVRGHFANISYNNEEDRLTVFSDYLPGSEALRDKFWRDFLDLDRDYAQIKRRLSADGPVLESAILSAGGIRILHQEPWETLVSFVISQNNHIPRIRGCVDALCRNFGDRIGSFQGRDLYAFPTIRRLATLPASELNICKLGYRAQYVAETARQVDVDGGAFLATGDTADPEKLETYLLSLSGVGPKVAHCIMLFALRRFESFPIDVWMRRAMSELYGIPEEDEAGMHAYAREHFGDAAGIAQMYLFQYMRTRK
ncbi:MAG: 8-oxoguanine DNA glycosylase [Clostridiales bacterium]|nr:8-oxoguanine DNA glycosylase [Clostridiales bacterium]